MNINTFLRALDIYNSKGGKSQCSSRESCEGETPDLVILKDSDGHPVAQVSLSSNEVMHLAMASKAPRKIAPSSPENQQRWDPESYKRWATYVPELGRDLMGLLEPRPGERVLDLGCGDGTLTAHMAACGCSVLGVDRDAGFVKATRQRGLSALQADARRLVGPKLPAGSFDAVFSNAVLHWIPEAAAVIANVRRLLRDDGRFVGELGGAGNIATVRQALRQALHHRGINAASRDPWFFPTAEAYRHLLEDHGFQVTAIQLFPRPTPLPGPLSQWMDTFAAAFLDGLDQATRQAIVAQVSKGTASRLCSSDGLWTVDYVRLRFRAVKVG